MLAGTASSGRVLAALPSLADRSIDEREDLERGREALEALRTP